MSTHTYNYSYTTDFNSTLNENGLKDAINKNTAITTHCSNVGRTGDVVSITFLAQPTQAEKTELDGGLTQIEESPPLAESVLDLHDGAPSAPSPELVLNKPQPQDIGFEMCERDFKITTCKMTQSDAVEDLLINIITLEEEEWAGPELSLVNVYKIDGTGSMIACTDQADADTNGVLTIYQYKAIDQSDGTTEISYDVRSGALVYDPAIPAVERFDHRAYIVAAPDSGQSNYVRLFDGYIAARPAEGELSTESPTAKLLDPSLAPGLSNVIRIYIYHPAGQSNSHILWLLTYRPLGTF